MYLHYKSKLSQSPVFSELPDDILSNMLGHFKHMTISKGMVIDSSRFISDFCLIINGRVKVEQIDAESGNRATLFLLGAGDGFDVISLLDGQPHDATPTALDDLSLLYAPTQTVRDWINSHPEFNRNFLPYLGMRMRTMEDLATDLSTKDTVTRLARLILRHTLPESIDKDTIHPVRLINDLSHDALAHMMGSTRQVVNKHLQIMRREGILDDQSRHLVVSELEMLKEKAGVFLTRKH